LTGSSEHDQINTKNITFIYGMQTFTKRSDQKRIGVTGRIGSGKTYVINKIRDYLGKKGIGATHLDYDAIKREVLCSKKIDKYNAFRKDMVKLLELPEGDGDNCALSGDEIGKKIFFNAAAMASFHDALVPVMKEELAERINQAEDICLLEWSSLYEDRLLDLIDDRVIYVKADLELVKSRFSGNDMLENQLLARLESFRDDNLRLADINDYIKHHGGKLLELEGNEQYNDSKLANIYDFIVG